MPNPKTIKEIEGEFKEKSKEETNWIQQDGSTYSTIGMTVNETDRFISSSLLSLLDEVENRLPAGIDMTNSYRQKVIKILSDLREK